MKTISEYIKEALVNESVKDLSTDQALKVLMKIEKWNSPDNNKKLMAEYMSAGDVEEYDKKYWEAETIGVKGMIDGIRIFIESYAKNGKVDMGELQDWLLDTFDDTDDLIRDMENTYKDEDWDGESVMQWFNTVSQKVARVEWFAF